MKGDARQALSQLRQKMRGEPDKKAKPKSSSAAKAKAQKANKHPTPTQAGQKPKKTKKRSHKANKSTAPRLPQNKLGGTLTADFGKLLALWRKAHDAEGKPVEAAMQAFEQALAASQTELVQRAETQPEAVIDDSLPIAEHVNEIISALSTNQVIVVAGETGSGKTTQLPLICLKAGRGIAGMIGCTQPRRVAARSVASRVASIVQSPIGGVVGYQVRFSDQVGERTRIKFMTDGIALAEIPHDRHLSRYDTLIIDEAHERSLNIDFLLGYLKKVLKKRPDLKVVITSATIDTARFAKHFNDAPVIEVAGRTHPVTMRYRPLEDASKSGDKQSPVIDGVLDALDEIHAEQRGSMGGDVLVFLPGEREIREAHHAIGKRRYPHTEVLPMYARLSARDQDRIFKPGSARRIVLATNVAETSITVPRITYVIDPGYARVKRYSTRLKVDRLEVEAVSQASANQRAGRCGRIAPGTCYRLFSEQDYLARDEFSAPEILRSSLAGVILRMLDLGLGNIDDFDFVEKPEPKAIRDGWQQLVELGAVESMQSTRLTRIGKTMARLPIDVHMARMLVEAKAFNVLDDAGIIVAFLSVQDPRDRPADKQQAADEAHAHYADPSSDFAGILNLWHDYMQASQSLSRKPLMEWCQKRFLSPNRMREWRELRRQLLIAEDKLGWKRGQQDSDQTPSEAVLNERLHRALMAGVPTQVGLLDEKGQFIAPRQRKFRIFPSSGLAKKPPKWVMTALFLETSQLWGLNVAQIQPEWVLQQCEHLLAYSHFDPRWSKKQGRALISERVTLFGLVLVPSRSVSLSRFDAEQARELLMLDGLVRGEVHLRASFLKHNLAVLAKVQEEEAKARRVGMVLDEDAQADFYRARLPDDVTDAAGLDAWYRKASPEERQRLHWSEQDLLVDEGADAEQFPKHMYFGGQKFALRYRFEPGAEDDGVNLQVPLHLLNLLDAERLSWPVPGFTHEYATALLRSLPKSQRRNIVPIPDFAQAFVERAQAEQWPLSKTMPQALAVFVRDVAGMDVSASVFDVDKAPWHLRTNIELLDERKKRLDHSRDVLVLQGRHGRKAEKAFQRIIGSLDEREPLTAFPDQDLKQTSKTKQGLTAHPALVLRGEQVFLEWRADADDAERLHRQGVTALAKQQLSRALQRNAKKLPVAATDALHYNALGSTQRLGDDLSDAAFVHLLNDWFDEFDVPRDAPTHQAMLEQTERRLYRVAFERHQQVAEVLRLHKELQPKLKPDIIGLGAANFDDIRAQMKALMPAGFAASIESGWLNELPRYLQAAIIRAERIPHDPQRDQARLLELMPLMQQLEAAEQDLGVVLHDVRRMMQELRISLFAQELGTKETVSTKRVQQALNAYCR